MIYLQVKRISLALCLLFIVGCCGPKSNVPLTAFPPRGTIVEYTKPPVVAYDNKTATYVITKEMMNNAVMNQLFVDEVLRWRRDNSIR